MRASCLKAVHSNLKRSKHVAVKQAGAIGAHGSNCTLIPFRPRQPGRCYAAASDGNGSNGGGAKGRPRKKRSQPEEDPSSFSKWIKLDKSVTSGSAQAIDAARLLQLKFITQQKDFMQRRLDPVKHIQGKALQVYCKGFTELQNTYCEAKIRLVTPQDMPPGAMSMVLPDLQHLLFLGLLPKDAHASSSGSSSSHSDGATGRNPPAGSTASTGGAHAQAMEAVSSHTMLINHVVALLTNQQLPGINAPAEKLPRLKAPLFTPLCAKVLDVCETMRASGTLLENHSMCQQLQTGMYRVLRHVQHVPLRHGISIDACDPHDFLVALVAVLSGAVSTLYLSSTDFKKAASIAACTEVLGDIVHGLALLQDTSDLAAVTRVHMLAQLLALQQHPSAGATPGQVMGTVAELQSLLGLPSVGKALESHPLVAFDALRCLGDHYLARNAAGATALYSGALAAFTTFEDGCCDHYQELSTKQDQRSFVFYWVDIAAMQVPATAAAAGIRGVPASSGTGTATSKAASTEVGTVLTEASAAQDVSLAVPQSQAAGAVSTPPQASAPVASVSGVVVGSSKRSHRGADMSSGSCPVGAAVPTGAIDTQKEPAGTAPVADARKTKQVRAPAAASKASLQSEWARAANLPGAVFLHRARIRCFLNLVQATCLAGATPAAAGAPELTLVEAAEGLLELACHRRMADVSGESAATERPPASPADASSAAGNLEGVAVSSAGVAAPAASTSGALEWPNQERQALQDLLLAQVQQHPHLLGAALDMLRSSRAIQQMCRQQYSAQGSGPRQAQPAMAVMKGRSQHGVRIAVDAAAKEGMPINGSASSSSSSSNDRLGADSAPSSSSAAGSRNAGSSSTRGDVAGSMAAARQLPGQLAVPLPMARACLNVGGFSVLSPRIRHLYEHWYLPTEDTAIHDFTRSFASIQRQLALLLSPQACLRAPAQRGVLPSVPWKQLAAGAEQLLDLWQRRPGSLEPTPYQQAWLLLAGMFRDPEGQPLPGLVLRPVLQQQQQQQQQAPAPTRGANGPSSSLDPSSTGLEVGSSSGSHVAAALQPDVTVSLDTTLQLGSATSSSSSATVFSSSSGDDAQGAEAAPRELSASSHAAPTQDSHGTLPHTSASAAAVHALTETTGPGLHTPTADTADAAGAEPHATKQQQQQEGFPARLAAPRLQSLYDRPWVLLCAKGVPVSLTTLPVLQSWFQLSVYNLVGAAHLLSTKLATMERDQPIATVITLALQRRIIAAGRAAADAIAPVRASKRSIRSTATGGTDVPVGGAKPATLKAFALGPRPGKTLAAGTSPEAAAGHAVLFSLGAATRAPMAPELKLELVLLLSRVPDKSHTAAEAFTDMVSRFLQRPANPTLVGSSAAADVNAAAAEAAGEDATQLSEQLLQPGPVRQADPRVSEAASVSAQAAASTTGMSAAAGSRDSDELTLDGAQQSTLSTNDSVTTVSSGASTSADDSGQQSTAELPREASSLNQAVPSTTAPASQALRFTVGQHRVLGKAGRRTASRYKSKLLTTQGWPELARPTFGQLDTAARVLVRAELRKGRAPRAAQALALIMPACSAAPEGIALLRWGVEQLLRMRQPYLALETIKSAQAAGCCSPALVTPLVHYCIQAGSDHCLEALMAALPPSPSHPLTSSMLELLLELVLQAEVPAAAAAAADRGADYGGGSCTLSWLCPLLGLAAAKIGYVPSDEVCLRLLGRLVREGSLKAALASVSVGLPPSHSGHGSSSDDVAGSHAGSGDRESRRYGQQQQQQELQRRRQWPLEELVCCCGSGMQARLLLLAATQKLPREGWLTAPRSVAAGTAWSQQLAAAVFQLLAGADHAAIAAAAAAQLLQDVAPQLPAAEGAPTMAAPPGSALDAPGTDDNGADSVSLSGSQMRMYLEAEGFTPSDALLISQQQLQQQAAAHSSTTRPARPPACSPAAAMSSAPPAAAAAAAPNLAARKELCEQLLQELAQQRLLPDSGLPVLLLALHDYSVRQHGTVLHLDAPGAPLMASKLFIAKVLCGRIKEANSMLGQLSKDPACLDALLQTIIRDKLAAMPQLTNHIRWACLYAVDAARSVRTDDSSGTREFGSPDGSADAEPAPSEQGECAAQASSLECEEAQQWRWRDRPLLVKCLIVGQQCPDPEVLQQVYDTMSIGEILEAAATVARCGRPGDARPLLKHLFARDGVRAAAEAPEFSWLVNALAGSWRRRLDHKVPAGCAPYLAALLVAATRSRAVDMSQRLSGAGKRLAIAICVSQGNYLTALKLWTAWQVRHSVSDAGMVVLGFLLVACAEVGDYAAGEALLPFLRPAQLLPDPAPQPATPASAAAAATSSSSGSRSKAAAAAANVPAAASRMPWALPEPASSQVHSPAVFQAYLQIIAAATFNRRAPKRGPSASLCPHDVRQQLQGAASVSELEKVVSRFQRMLRGETLEVALGSLLRLWREVDAPAGSGMAPTVRKPGRPLSSARKKQQLQAVMLGHYLLTRWKEEQAEPASRQQRASLMGGMLEEVQRAAQTHAAAVVAAIAARDPKAASARPQRRAGSDKRGTSADDARKGVAKPAREAGGVAVVASARGGRVKPIAAAAGMGEGGVAGGGLSQVVAQPTVKRRRSPNKASL